MEITKLCKIYFGLFRDLVRKNQKKAPFFLIAFVLYLLYGTESLRNIGAFIQGIATLIGVFWVQDAFTQYLRQERSSAACEILNEFKSFDLYIEKITHNPILYMYEGYSPTHIPEVKDPNACPHEERPLRLVANRIDELKQKVNVLMSKIRPQDARLVSKYMKEIEDMGVHIIDSLHTAITQGEKHTTSGKDMHEAAKNTVKPTAADAPYKPLEKYGKVVKLRVRDIETVLRPIISGDAEYELNNVGR